ncbi:cation acetate symporter [Egibacter rhizosphaerae]|uniref:Cation acetate symporter n=2 Tax=Egibacter rhizosphaerae TaxID=1670831 RepID=A0A411YLJ6_9ACTN|nr:cation acetate symporter [Egibacter rhizosphaerae]
MATLALALMVAVLLAVAARPRRASTLDFYLAGQRVGVATNASAICGDYFSAASFLGVAAAVYAAGLDGIWYATGFAAGFVPVVLFVAAPLRRFGEFSLPDFLGRRLGSERVRLAAVLVVQLVIVSYLVPQAVASGITWELLVGAGIGGLSPYVTGVLVSTAAITALVGLGGMRGATWTQAVQFAFLLLVLLWLTGVTVADGFSYPDAVAEVSETPLANPVPVEDGSGEEAGATAGGAVEGRQGWELRAVPDRIDGGAARFDQPGARYGPASQLALVITLILGTAGLPHVMNRFFTSPTGRAARLTTVWVLGAAGLFYALAVLLGVAARAAIADAADGTPWLAELTVDGVLRVPEHALLALGRLAAGGAGLGVLAAAALVAVMSTIAGLLLAGAASWGHDVYERHLNPRATQRQAMRAGRGAVVVVAAIGAAVAVTLRPAELSGLFPSLVATMVTWAFTLAGSALTPVLLLAIWWRRTTAAGAVAGMVTGSVVAIGAFLAGVVGVAGEGDVAGVLLAPAVLGAPAAMLVTVVVSKVTPTPVDLDRTWVRMHGTAADRQAERLAELTIRGLADPDEPRTPRNGRR